jgi:Sec-independent protein secretion pathway component TatC
MWSVGISVLEVALCLAVAGAIALTRGPARRWLSALLAITVIAAAVTPSDLVSTLTVMAVLSAAFALGVYAAPLLRKANGMAGQ